MNKVIFIGGEERPVNFGRNFWGEVETLSNKGFGELLKNWSEEARSFKTQTIIAYSALKWGLYNQDNGLEPNPKFTKYKVAVWIDENTNSMEEIFKALIDSLPKKKEEQKEVESSTGT